MGPDERPAAPPGSGVRSSIGGRGDGDRRAGEVMMSSSMSIIAEVTADILGDIRTKVPSLWEGIAERRNMANPIVVDIYHGDGHLEIIHGRIRLSGGQRILLC
jgi:hypothetical protein